MERLSQRDYSGFLKDSKNREAIKSWSDLHWAAALGDLQTIRSLRDTNNINVKDSRGWTPLHWAVLFTDNLETIDLLLDSGAKIKGKNQHGVTPTHLAAEYGPMEYIEWLFIAGANKEAVDKNGMRPLHRAVYSGRRDVIEQLLTQYKVDLDPRDHLGRTPLHLAVMGGQREIVKLFLRMGADIHAKDVFGEVPLHKSILTKDSALVKLLLEFGADRQAIMISDETSLHRAVKFDFIDIVKVLLTEFVEMDLYEYVNLRDNHRRIALHYAVKNRNKTLASLLLNEGANIFLEDIWGETPLSEAKNLEDMKMYRFLEEGYKKFRESNKEFFSKNFKTTPCGY